MGNLYSTFESRLNGRKEAEKTAFAEAKEEWEAAQESKKKGGVLNDG